MYEAKIRLRIASADAHYGGGLVDGAHLLKLFGDVATELLIYTDGDEGLFVAYDNVEFLAPVRAGDYIEASAVITGYGNTSRKMAFKAERVIESLPGSDSAAQILESPRLVCRATGTCMVAKEKQRYKPPRR